MTDSRLSVQKLLTLAGAMVAILALVLIAVIGSDKDVPAAATADVSFAPFQEDSTLPGTKTPNSISYHIQSTVTRPISRTRQCISRPQSSTPEPQAYPSIAEGPVPATYYVSKTGSNANGKSWATAWDELDQIDWSVIQPGDVILIDGGTVACPPTGADYRGDSCGMVYNTTLAVNASGEPGRPIAIKLAEEPGRDGTVIIDGGVVGPKPCPGYPGELYPDFPVPSSPGNIDPNNPHRLGIDLESAQWLVVDGTQWGGIEIRNHERTGFYFNQSQNSTARYLKIHHNRGHDFASAVTMLPLSKNNTLSHSEMFGNGQDAVRPIGDNFTLEYNYIHDHYCYHPDGIQGAYPDTVIENLTIRYNIFQNFGNLVAQSDGYKHGQGIFIGEVAQGHDAWGSNVEIYNNLIIGTNGSPIVTKNPKSTNFNIHHNTIVDTGGHGVNYASGGATAPMSIHDNIFYNTPGLWLPTNGGKTAVTDNCLYSGYLAPEGDFQESGTINQDPLFVNPSNGDYSLRPNSPCTGKGSSITSVAQLLRQPAPTP